MIQQLYKLNPEYKGKVAFIRATFSKKAERTTKSHAPFVLGVKEPEQANLVCERGLVIGGELFDVELYYSGAKAKRCYNCQLYTSYIAKHYTVRTRCGSCRGLYRSDKCTEKGKVYCVPCKKGGHSAFSPECKTWQEKCSQARESYITRPRRFQVEATTTTTTFALLIG